MAQQSLGYKLPTGSVSGIRNLSKKGPIFMGPFSVIEGGIEYEV